MRAKKGIVTSQKQEKTVVVTVHRYEMHPKYKKRFRISRKFQVHNPDNKQFEIGDEVTFYETKPISKSKKWTLEQPNNAKV